MATRKQTSKKTGNYSRRTTTIGDNGKTESSSSKPPGAISRRTVSHKNGKMRTTYSHTTGGGLRRTSSKTQTLVRNVKPKKASSRRSRGRRSSGSGSFPWKTILFIALLVWLLIL